MAAPISSGFYRKIDNITRLLLFLSKVRYKSGDIMFEVVLLRIALCNRAKSLQNISALSAL